MNISNGYLEIIFGPMFSGKTTYLIEKYKQHKSLGHTTCVINHILDKDRYGENLCSHDNIQINCVYVQNLFELFRNQELMTSIQNSQVILINECQFFEDLLDFVLPLVETDNKTVYVCGLDSDFERKKFGKLLDLIPYCDNIVKLKSLCVRCNNGIPALFSKRITINRNTVEIGSDNYIPLCRKCYLHGTSSSSY